MPVHIGLNGYGKEIIILLGYSCVCSFVGHLLRKTLLPVHARDSTRNLADFCQILYCGGVPKLSGTFQHWLKSVKNDITLRLTLILLTWRIWWANNASKWQMGFNLAFKVLTRLCAHLEHKLLHSCQSHECHKTHREKMIYDCCTQYIFYVSVMVFAATFPSLYIQYTSSTYWSYLNNDFLRIYKVLWILLKEASVN